ncbi:MAG: hypothetical protein A3J76_02490 [Candidatus Moranbacteria bacterium RBG_13_45_13]|nr:MAG: hypothetical protein A3J76_02490 [Candidatus Moranbacteria bacterium RBG_13_45_13]
MTNEHPKKYSAFIQKHNREMLIGFGALLVIAIRFVFPAKLDGEIFWINLALFFLFPWLIIRLLLKEDLKSFGLSWGNRKIGFTLSVVVTLLFVGANYLIISKPALRNQLQVSPDLAKGFWTFFWFIFFVSLPLHFFWEFFFRGFIQLGLEKKLAYSGIFLQALLQTSGYLKSPWLIIFLIFSSALAAGFVARQSRSIIYSFVSMWLISTSLDIMIARFIHQGII